MVRDPSSMILLPVAVDPVNEIMSTRGSRISSSATELSDVVTTLTTPGGISVFSAISLPRRVPLHGVSGAGLTTTELPVARASANFWTVRRKGKFQER